MDHGDPMAYDAPEGAFGNTMARGGLMACNEAMAFAGPTACGDPVVCCGAMARSHVVCGDPMANHWWL